MRIVEESSGELDVSHFDAVHTIGLNDDRRTVEVLCDLGLIRDRPCRNELSPSIQLGCYSVPPNEQIGDNNLVLLLPPNFGPKDSLDQAELSSSAVPNSIPDLAQDDVDQARHK